MCESSTTTTKRRAVRCNFSNSTLTYKYKYLWQFGGNHGTGTSVRLVRARMACMEHTLPHSPLPPNVLYKTNKTLDWTVLYFDVPAVTDEEDVRDVYEFTGPMLGSGSFATVLMVKSKASGLEYAMKKVS